MYFCFRLKPWSKNISRSLIKEPKIFLWDWSNITNNGFKIENMVAFHLHKAVHFWNDIGLGEYDLFFLRDKSKREVDFLLTKNKAPWIIIEVKSSMNDALNPNLSYFKEKTRAPLAFQVAFDYEYFKIDFRSLTTPKIIPLSAFLSQLI